MVDDIPTLYDWAGGMDAEHAGYVAVWLAEVFGGPAVYTADHGGYPRMVGEHLGMAITEAQRRRWLNLMMDAADERRLRTVRVEVPPFWGAVSRHDRGAAPAGAAAGQGGGRPPPLRPGW